MVMQSGLYALLKHTGFLKTIALAVKGRMTTDKSKDMPNFSNAQIDSYARLLDYNRSIFNLFNLVLANSLSTEQIYRRNFLHPLINTFVFLMTVSFKRLIIEVAFVQLIRL